MRTFCEQASAYEPRSGYTYEDYLTLPDDGLRSEILNGFLVQEPAPNPHHQRVVVRLWRILTDYFSSLDPYGEVFVAPFDVKLSSNSIVQPDLVYISGERNAGDEALLEALPELVIEVLSPSTRVRDRLQKTELFRQAKIPHYWLVDPEAGTIEALALQGEHYAIVATAHGNQTFSHPKFFELALDIETICQKPKR